MGNLFYLLAPQIGCDVSELPLLHKNNLFIHNAFTFNRSKGNSNNQTINRYEHRQQRKTQSTSTHH